MANNNNKFVSRENAKTLWGYMIDLLTGKQNKLTFDDTPTQNSDNPVKSGGIFTALAGKGTYSKPQNGIPKTDLESAVQTSLGLADSALQSFTETDPTVPSWAKENSKPTYNSDEISDTNRTHKFATAAQLTQIITNQNNIGLVAKYGGGLNKLEVTATSTGIFTVNPDKSVTINGSTGAGEYAVLTLGYFSCVANQYYLGGLTGGSSTTYYMDINGGGHQNMTFGAFSKIAYNFDNAAVRIVVTPNQTVNTTVYPMIITAEDYAINNYPAYQPYAVSNSSLTQLETEDRAALAEEIDAGAKNKCNWATATENYHQACSWTKTDTSLTVTSTGAWGHVRYSIGTLPKGTYTLYVKISSYSAESATCKLGIGADEGSLVSITGNGVVSMNFTLSSDSNVNLYFYANWNVESYANTYVASDIMVSTKAAFDVSQKYVPHKGTFGNKAVGTIDLNNLIEEGNYYVSSATKANHHAPKDGYYFVDVYTTLNGEKWQRAYRINEPQYVYQRMMTANTWGTWYVFAGTAVT